jgi:type I restriction enzyme S subunit
MDTVDQKNGGLQPRLGVLQDLFRNLLHELMTAKTRVHDIKIPAVNPAKN